MELSDYSSLFDILIKRMVWRFIDEPFKMFLIVRNLKINDLGDRDMVSNIEKNSIKKQEREWEKLFNAFYDGVWVTDGEGRTVMINHAYEQLTGVKKENVLGRLAHDLLNEGILAQSAIPGVMETHKPVTIINKINNKRLLVTGVPVFQDGNLYRIVCNVRDITQLTDLQKEIEIKDEIINHYESEIMKFKDTLNQMDSSPVIRTSQMRNLYELAQHVSATSSTIIILGESGVGKEVLANWIHQNSPRRDKPLIKVNCSAIPESLIEAELFGYEQGAFTGANRRKAGLFEMADKGTIFLDEIGELPLNMQSKLLRVLQEKEIQRVGGGKTMSIDVRIISATNRSLDKMISEGLFREDLYYRLNVIPFVMPPLRERSEEIPILAAHFLNQFNRMYQRQVEIGPVIVQRMMQYNWPGNVRELKNIIERLVVMSKDNQMSLDLLTDYIGNLKASVPLTNNKPGKSLRDHITNYEKQIISENLQRAKSIRQAASMLGVSHSTLLRKIQLYKMDYRSLVGLKR